MILLDTQLLLWAAMAPDRLASRTRQLIELGGDEAKKANEEQNAAHKDLLEALKEALDGKVKAVRVSSRLKRHAVCLIADGSLSLEMERVLKSMPGAQDHEINAERILELNPEHAVFSKLEALRGTEPEKFKAYANILYAQAQLLEGMLPDDIGEYAEHVLGLMQ